MDVSTPGSCCCVQAHFLLTQQKDVWLISNSLLPCHNFLSEVLAEVRPYSILLSAVSPSACYPLLTLLILPSARPNTGSVGKLFSCPRLPCLSLATLFLLSVCLHSADFPPSPSSSPSHYLSFTLHLSTSCGSSPLSPSLLLTSPSVCSACVKKCWAEQGWIYWGYSTSLDVA